MSKYWLFEMDIFVEGEMEGVGVQQVVESDGDFAPFDKVHRSIADECPAPINISFKLVQEIDLECFHYFAEWNNLKKAIEFFTYKSHKKRNFEIILINKQISIDY